MAEKRSNKKIHWLVSIILKDGYWEYGLVWRIACVKTNQDEEHNITATTDAKKVTCIRCRKAHKKFIESIW